MTDRISKERRSRNMARIKGRDTTPELHVRSSLHVRGFRFRLQVRELPGRPDVVLPRYRMAVFVHGCFWHRHPGCRLAVMPTTNRDFWMKKFRDNRLRDRRSINALRAAGWRVHVVWECEIDGGESHRELLRALTRLRTNLALRDHNPRKTPSSSLHAVTGEV